MYSKQNGIYTIIAFIVFSFFSVSQTWAQQKSKVDPGLKEAYENYWKVEGAAAKEQQLQAILKQFPPGQTSGAGQVYPRMYENMADTWLREANGNKFNTYSKKLENKTMLYRQSLAVLADWSSEKQHLELAQAVGRQIVDFMVEQDEDSPHWQAKALNIYGYVLQAFGQNNKAIGYYEKALALYEQQGMLPPEFMNRYALALSEQGHIARAQKQLETAVMEGKYNDETKSQLKGVYQQMRGTESGYKKYQQALLEVARQRAFAKASDKQLAQAKQATGFTLRNLDGEQVSLDDMNGKVVVLDFWATWCGPCLASFPGMQLAVDKYADDPDVAFLFVNTAQNEENAQQVVQDFIDNEGYSFHVLMDSDDSVAKDFGVKGIPMKFVIDPAGKIQFRTAGSDGIDESILNQITAMIEIAKQES